MNLKEVVERLNEIRSTLNNSETRNKLTTEEISKLGEETKELIAKETELRNEEAKNIQKAIEERKEDLNMSNVNAIEERKALAEEDLRLLKQGRAIKVNANPNIGIDTGLAQTVVPAFKPYSNLLDVVQIKDRKGLESYTQPYVQGYAEGVYTDEAAAYTETDPKFGLAVISKSKITAYTEVSEEFEKLASEAYKDEIVNNITIAIKRKIIKEALVGDGTTNHLTGIFSTAAKAIDVNKDLEVSALDDTTIDTVLANYGGDFETTFGFFLFSKKTLGELAAVRTKAGDKAYTIDYKAQTINGLPYILTTAIKGFTEASVSDYVMAYGTADAIEIAQFSDLEISKSNDFKFNQGTIAYKGTGLFGSNVIKYNGFVRVKKSA